MTNEIYLDNAATSWPKPPQVATASNHFMTQLGITPNRSVSFRSQIVDQTIQSLRTDLQTVLNCPEEEIHFCFSATDGLNLAISGFLHKVMRDRSLPSGRNIKEKIHVITTATEHNSVLRPLHYWEEFGWIQLTIIPCDEKGNVLPEDLSGAIRENTGLFVCSHASNVTGTVQDAMEFGRICQQNKIFFILDAAQTGGTCLFDFRKMGCDVAVCSGHKSLLGPMGTGVLMVRRGAETWLDPARQGGTGTQSHEMRMPTEPKSKWAAGHQNLPGLFGLAEAAKYLASQNLFQSHQKSWQLCSRLAEELGKMDGVQILGNWTDRNHDFNRSTAVLSLVHSDLPAPVLAQGLLEAGNVVTRAGFHCSPLIHNYLSSSQGGTLRVSPGNFSTEQDVLQAVESLGSIIQF